MGLITPGQVTYSPGSGSTQNYYVVRNGKLVNILKAVPTNTGLGFQYPSYENTSRINYPAPTIQQLPKTLDVTVLEEVRVSTDDEKKTAALSLRYFDERGAGTSWSDGRVTLAAGASSNQLVAGNFGFNVPANAVIKGVEITMDKSVPVGALASEVVNVMPCGFSPPFTGNLDAPDFWITTGWKAAIWNGLFWSTTGPLTISDAGTSYLFPNITAFPAEFFSSTYTSLKITVKYINPVVPSPGGINFQLNIVLPDGDQLIVAVSSWLEVADFTLPITMESSFFDINHNLSPWSPGDPTRPFTSQAVLFIGEAPDAIGTDYITADSVEWLTIEFIK